MTTVIRGYSSGDYAVRQLLSGELAVARTTGRLSTGLRVRTAADDAAALNIATGMTSRLRGVHESIKHLQDGISLLNVAEGALGESVGIVQRMRELTLQARTSVVSDQQRRAIGAEILKLRTALEYTLDHAQFNQTYLFRGIAPSGQTDEGTVAQTGGTLLPNSDLTIPDDGPGVRVAAIDVSRSSTAVTEWTITKVGDDQITLAQSNPPGGSLSQTVQIEPMYQPETGTQILNFNLLGVVITLEGHDPEGGVLNGDGTTMATLMDGATIQTAPQGLGGTGGISAASRFIINPEVHGQVELKVTRLQTSSLGGGDATLFGGDKYWLADLITDEDVVSTSEKTTRLLAVADAALQQLLDERSRLGGEVNKLESYLRDLLSQKENLEASRSRIEDADMAHESVEHVRNTSLQDLRTTVAAQAVRLSDVTVTLIRSGSLIG